MAAWIASNRLTYSAFSKLTRSGTATIPKSTNPCKKPWVCSFMAFAVTSLLEAHFPDLVDTRFTSRMERTLDDISTGEVDWLPYLREFYCGETGLSNQVKEQESQIDSKLARTVELVGLEAKVCIGRFGPYIEVDNGSGVLKASIPKDLTPDRLDSEQVEALLKQKASEPEELGQHPETGDTIYLLNGNYGLHQAISRTARFFAQDTQPCSRRI
ncbi:MAG: hypothetical protein EBE86_020650 [Hormoscilla sp. GUM202]|nr:hypothetical protein [Hormoscilla sp. GUM202]